MPDELFEDMPEPRPFLEDGSQFGISRATFEAMDEDEQRKLMRNWFFQNFEDPVNSTPRDDETKEYVFLWGGPYDAKEQLWDKFGQSVSEALIEGVANEVEGDGTVDWAPAPNSPFYDDGRPDEDGAETEPLEQFLSNLPDQPGPRYGTTEDREARNAAEDALAQLESVLPPAASAGIGHNRPPESIEDEGIGSDLRPIVQELRTELQKAQPEITVVKQLTAMLGSAVVASVTWVGHKLDVMIEEAAKSIGKRAGEAALAGILILDPNIRAGISSVLHAVANWLHLVTLPF